MIAERFVLSVGFVFAFSSGVQRDAKACVPDFGAVKTRSHEERMAACEGGDALACRRAKRIVRACAMGDRFSCTWILDDDSFRAQDLALLVIRAHCYTGDGWACTIMRDDARFTASEHLSAEEGRCLFGVAGVCEGMPEAEEPVVVEEFPTPTTAPEDFNVCRGDADCLARVCSVHGRHEACVAACRAADPSSCALLESSDFDPTPLTRKLEPRCRKGETAACVSIWALNGAHVCSRAMMPPERFAIGRRGLERACAQGWESYDCDGPLPEQAGWP